MSSTEHNCRHCADCTDPISFLPGFPESHRDILSQKVVCRRLKKGSTLFREGDKADAIYMIQSGRIKLTRWDADGHEQIAGIFSDREAIWEGLLLEGSVFPYSAECLTQVSVCILYGADLQELLKDPAVSLHMLTMLSRKLHDANERNLVLSTKDPKARLAAFLLYRSKRDREEIIHIKLDDISASLNLRPETISRKINEMIEEGTIERRGKSGLRILDFESLEDLKAW